MSAAPGGGASSGGGSSNKVAGLLLGGGLIAIIAILGPRIAGGDDDDPKPAPTSQGLPSGGGAPATQALTAQPTVRPQSTTRPTQTADDELRGDPDNVILTVTVYGMPGRVGAESVDRSIEIRQRQKGSCSPDDQYPGPCITYYVAKRGTAMRIYGGDSQAGFWPALDSVNGAGCNVSGPLRADFSCRSRCSQTWAWKLTTPGAQPTAARSLTPNAPPTSATRGRHGQHAASSTLATVARHPRSDRKGGATADTHAKPSPPRAGQSQRTRPTRPRQSPAVCRDFPAT